MGRILLASVVLLLTAVAVAPTASADHVSAPCGDIGWHPEPPPGWNTYCIVEGAALQVAHNAFLAAECLAGYNPFIHGLNYVIDCASHL